ncbi:MAG: ABC transporter permease [Bryobacterales bacterium]|nr:ABC transporter permease [Bryobacterales bacterium]
MSVEYRDVKVETRDGLVRISSNVENKSGEAWRPSEGFAFGYHIFDPETDTLVVDGARTVPSGDIAAGELTAVSLEFRMPKEPGRYRIVVSPLMEHGGWHYQKGWPFLLIDAVVDARGAHLEPVRTATSASLGRARAIRALGRAFTLPAAVVWNNWSLIRTLTRRDILGRYRGSFGGVVWTALTPLLLMLTYFFVFGIVLESKFGNDPSRSGYVLYFLAGMLPWLAFSEAVGRAPTLMLEYRNFVKKLVFPVETLPVNLVAAGLVTQVFAVMLFLAGLLIARGSVPASALWMPVLLVPQILLTLGLCWFLAALGVFVRDLGQLIGFLLTLWFFLTPICYEETKLPAMALPLLGKNPIFVLVRAYRLILLDGRPPEWAAMWKLWVASAAVFVAGHAWFYKLRKSFADII